MSARMRAKFEIRSIETVVGGDTETLKMGAVAKSGGYPEDGSDEDNTYAKYSPSANLSITIANPALIGKFKTGEKYYVDFTPVE